MPSIPRRVCAGPAGSPGVPAAEFWRAAGELTPAPVCGGIVMRLLCLSLLLPGLCSLFAQLRPNEAADIEKAWAAGPRLSGAGVTVRRGFDQKAAAENTNTDASGIARASTARWERVEIHLPRAADAEHAACLMVDSKCQPLPVGASLDRKNGILYWDVPNAYKGDFDLVFLQPGSRAGAVRISVAASVATRLK